MTKRALSAVAGFLSCCLSLSAQQTLSSGPLQSDFATLDRQSLRSPSLSLEDRQLFFFSTAFGRMDSTMNFLPSFSPWEPQSFAFPYTPSRRNSLDNFVEMRAPDRIYAGGEVGFLYGRSSGKYGREDFQGYIIGTVGNEKFSITAGILHQESTINIPRRRR